jgi:histone H1/5
MIVEAIAALKERGGSSSVAISKHVESKYGAKLPANFKKLISGNLKRLIAAGRRRP